MTGGNSGPRSHHKIVLRATPPQKSSLIQQALRDVFWQNVNAEIHHLADFQAERVLRQFDSNIAGMNEY